MLTEIIACKDFCTIDKIKLTDIPTKLEKVLAKFEKVGDVKLDDVTRIDTEARKYTYSIGANS